MLMSGDESGRVRGGGGARLDEAAVDDELDAVDRHASLVTLWLACKRGLS
jgi:hypothetical protein